MFKFTNINTRHVLKSHIKSHTKVNIKYTVANWHRSGTHIVNFEYIQHVNWIFLNLRKYLSISIRENLESIKIKIKNLDEAVFRLQINICLKFRIKTLAKWETYLQSAITTMKLGIYLKLTLETLLKACAICSKLAIKMLEQHVQSGQS